MRAVKEGYVANSTFWLVDENDEIVAVTNLRHELTEALLRYGGHIGYGVRPSARLRGYATQALRLSLQEARSLGIYDVLITCSSDNSGSVGAIRRNEGRLEEEKYMEEHDRIIQRYWIRQ